MIEDKKKIEKLLLEYIKIIFSEYGDYIDNENMKYVLNNKNLVEFNSSDSISFLVKNGILYLPKSAYPMVSIFEKNINYGINPNDARKLEDYLDTNTTYYDYINHFILAGLTPYEYFKESLLHEAMHLCGNCGGNPLEEGFTELKSRELAQKFKIKIAAYGYPKEVEVAKKVQEILGKDVCDQLTFISYEKRRSFLTETGGIEKTDMFYRVAKMMNELSCSYNEKIQTISNPQEKAEIYSELDYSSVLDYLEHFHNIVL